MKQFYIGCGRNKGGKKFSELPMDELSVKEIEGVKSIALHTFCRNGGTMPIALVVEENTSKKHSFVGGVAFCCEERNGWSQRQ